MLRRDKFIILKFKKSVVSSHCLCVYVCVVSDCNGCGRDIKNGQALLALGGRWHIGCFKCKTCRKALSGEYISK